MSLVIMILDNSTEITAEKPIYSPLVTLFKLKTDVKAANSYSLTFNDIINLSILGTIIEKNPKAANRPENFK